jgi:hypothetical protein
VSDQDNKPWEWGDKGVPHNPINHYPEGTRFLCCGYDGHMNQFSQGNYVRYEDYARLKAEVERLKSEPDALTAYLYADTLRRDDIKTLKAHVKRLTKAGDGLHKSMLEIGCNEMADNFQHDAWYGSMKDWHVAKEGKGQP